MLAARLASGETARFAGAFSVVAITAAARCRIALTLSVAHTQAVVAEVCDRVARDHDRWETGDRDAHRDRWYRRGTRGLPPRQGR